MKKETLQLLHSILRNLPATKIDLLARALERGRLDYLSSSVSVAGLLDLSGQSLELVVRFLRSDTNPVVLYTALQSGHFILAGQAEHTEKVELVWTGPVNISVPARSTREVMCEMAGRASYSIDLVGYSLSSGCESVIECLLGARRRGVQSIRIFADRLERQLSVIETFWPPDIAPPEYFTKTEGPSDPMASLHAKMMLVDDRELLITSANLTYHGLSANIEAGLLVTGKTAKKVAKLLASLIKFELVQKINMPGENHEL